MLLIVESSIDLHRESTGELSSVVIESPLLDRRSVTVLTGHVGRDGRTSSRRSGRKCGGGGGGRRSSSCWVGDRL
jgi:hypothetical protein